tara:strand:+ start:5446 stop:6489 length:1044 start_codon:yes stop_codon:yes gene_type:complete
MSCTQYVGYLDTVLKDSASLTDAILVIDESGAKICLVVDLGGILVGTVTDGDVRRAIIEGKNLDCKIIDVMTEQPIFIGSEGDENSAFLLMSSKKIHHLPIVSDSGTILGLFVIDEFLAEDKFTNHVLIMAGGFGKRLRPHTDNVPKPMVLVRGKPILAHIIESAVSDGFSKFIISVFYLADIIIDYFGDGSKWGIEISYIQESKPLGTGGALGLIDPKPESPLLVVNGDILSSIKLSKLLRFHIDKNSSATMAVKPYELANPYGTVLTSGLDIVGFKEKPITFSYVNAGMYVINPCVVDMVIDNEFVGLPTLFERCMSSNITIKAYGVHESWIDIGRPGDLQSANQ